MMHEHSSCPLFLHYRFELDFPFTGLLSTVPDFCFTSLSGSLNFFLISQGSSASVHFVSERLLIQACENAQSCLQRDNVADSKTGEIFEYMQMLKKIKSLKDFALTKAGSGSGMCIMFQLPKIHVTFHMQIWLRYVMNFSFSILS